MTNFVKKSLTEWGVFSSDASDFSDTSELSESSEVLRSLR